LDQLREVDPVIVGDITLIRQQHRPATGCLSVASLIIVFFSRLL
jgi:hypothetical protein